MKFKNWTIDDLIDYLKQMKSAPKDRLDCHKVPRVSGEIDIVNGEPIDKAATTEGGDEIW